ncbi:hypothetical protein ACSV5S_20790 [Agrobacterium deltaense]|uniref:hypothetical protein n=1 Tax=Agrobacterium deltaense TaxID=1183412 RepID=UPI003FD61EC9
MENLIIEPLGDHPRGAFCCTLDKIDNFFKNNARKSHEAYAQRIFVACSPENKTPLGFYALTTMTFRPGMNDEADKKFGRFDAIPSIYLTMIGRHKDASKGIGAALMLDAFKRALQVREHVGVYALTLHAYNDKVLELYKTFGFEAFADPAQDSDEYKAMFIPLSTVAASFKESEQA